jgi:GNAT superfamily N-acetyltransferase
MEVQPSVVALALHPARELPPAPGIDRVEHDGILVVFTPYPNAQVVEPLDLEATGVGRAVATTRKLARERGKRLLAWWIAPGRDELGRALEQEGLVNQDTPGMEAIENAMVLVEPPRGRGDPEVAAKTVENYDEFVAAMSVLMDAFEIPEAMRAEAAPDFPKRWEEYSQSGNPQRQYLATIDGETVGQATAWCGDAGINMFGGAVLEHARGRGVYRALTLARWDEAVRRGTPALTVQAGRMSMPILAKLGFVPVGQIRVYVDELDAEGNT